MIPSPAKLKLIAILLSASMLAGLVSWASWSIASSRTEARERKIAEERVQQAIEDAEKRFQLQKELTTHYRGLAEEQFGKLLSKMDNIKLEHVTITRNITVERESNPEFYETPLPEGGIQEWEAARQLLR